MILPYLREQIQPFHERLEASADISSALASRSHYRELLQSFYGFHAPLEPALRAFPEWHEIGFSLADREKVPLLRQDVLDLGMTGEEIAALAVCSPCIGSSDGFARALGCAYVVEGSTLGGQVIARELAAIGVTPLHGGRYFASYGPAVGRMWADFRRMLERQSESLDRDEIAAGAMETFTALERWLAHRRATEKMAQV